jgi:hypothetical protein
LIRPEFRERKELDASVLRSVGHFSITSPSYDHSKSAVARTIALSSFNSGGVAYFSFLLTEVGGRAIVLAVRIATISGTDFHPNCTRGRCQHSDHRHSRQSLLYDVQIFLSIGARHKAVVEAGAHSLFSRKTSPSSFAILGIIRPEPWSPVSA